MTTFIPRLAQIAAGHGAGKPLPTAADDTAARVNVDMLAAYVPQIRRRLGVGPAFSDKALLASLVSIARHPSQEARWQAAEASTLGQYLVSSGKDPQSTFPTLLALLPQPD